MNDYTEVRVEMSPCSEELTDIAAALLADVGFETFVPDATGLTAYIPVAQYSPELKSALDTPLLTGVTLDWSDTVIEGQDWNSEWEKHYFKPIVIEGRCVIHSSFHTDVPQAEYDIVIDPKMAFGTGHHSTTTLILQQLLQMPLEGKSVIDMGTGTGILSILAYMRCARPVTGIEIDEPAWENAIDNCRLNNSSDITMIHGDATALKDIGYKADILLANINRNVITADIAEYAKALKNGGQILLSGFYTHDIPVISEAAAGVGLTVENHTELNTWACVSLRKLPAVSIGKQ